MFYPVHRSDPWDLQVVVGVIGFLAVCVVVVWIMH
jgi:hypothetical protein